MCRYFSSLKIQRKWWDFFLVLYSVCSSLRRQRTAPTSGLWECITTLKAAQSFSCLNFSGWTLRVLYLGRFWRECSIFFLELAVFVTCFCLKPIKCWVLLSFLPAMYIQLCRWASSETVAAKWQKILLFYFNQENKFTYQHCYAFHSANWQANKNGYVTHF